MNADAPEPKTILILPQNDNSIDALFDEAVEELAKAEREKDK